VRRTETGRNEPSSHGSYFYLSYAQSPPLAGKVRADPDHWVRDFHRDLTSAVQSQASPNSGLGPGLFDQEIPPGADWKASLTAALSTAEVFVPLYSPGYFAMSWPGREWACFQQRLLNAGVENPLRRFAPVLWTPLPWELDPPGLREAMKDADREYADNGLRTLLRLQLYRPSYERVVGQIAGRVVDLAENFPLGPSAAPDIDHVPSEFQTEASGAYFAVTVAAPTISDLPQGRSRRGYGDSRVDWRPYPGDQELPLAQHAAQIAEQMDLAVLTTSIEKQGDEQTTRPGVILIDPWFVAAEAGRDSLESYVRGLPRWVLPLLVLDAEPDSRSIQLADLVRGMLSEKPRARVDVAERAVRGVSSLGDFAAVMPVLAAEAERQYLRHGPVQRSVPRAARPRLADGPSAPPPRPADAPPDHERETPDA
jgi:FxsC-like protein